MKFSIITLAFLFLSTTSFSETKLEKGKYIFMAAGCMNCHTPDKAKPLAGGFKIATNFGNFYTPNISSDTKFGIGNWSDQDFLKALRNGISPKKQFYYPAFPFTSYSKLTDEDILAMKAYIMSLPPQAVENKKSELKSPYNHRSLMFAWRSLNFRKYFIIRIFAIES
jgi:mono/diheme cytochrome c family protein